MAEDMVLILFILRILLKSIYILLVTFKVYVPNIPFQLKKKYIFEIRSTGK